ncbi:NB-ARC domain-containing protein [Streptomyces sp. S.PB5]|uniref:ATP-binding protein n=1 Tax=Streptomyces sp. S.PB5 TaxID=3020844 RepID=UPI0025AEE4B7|nr:NB-ARC domain-containing protein [Streptomyces sp. S.PB5]MDN3020558.1 hypothetical protein [Streptomyces sp. S.PB5]
MPTEKAVHGPGNLPPDPRGFVGRRRELALLAEELENGRGRLVTLVGVGGVGKTRLARQAAERARWMYPDGVRLVELSWLRSGGQVPLAVMEALGLADQTTGSAAEALCAWARDKRLLLVLDSCEPVLGGCVTLVADLLAAAPGVRILATSREVLGLPGERVVDVGPLPVGDGKGELAEAEALFAQRAMSVRTGFVVEGGNRQRVTDICRALDGIPLAIELAAARLESYSLDKLHQVLGDRLCSRFDLLTSEGGTGAPRHWTLRTTIGWSNELCAPLERLLWARLSVFAGTFTTGAATWVCSGGPLPADQVEDVLLRLVRQSVVLRHPTDAERFRLLDTVREYGADWLRGLGEEEAVRLRHREHYRRFAREACSDWNTGRQVAWCERIFAEQANLRAAMDGALAEPDGRVALEMAGTIGFLWRHCGLMRDAQRCLDLVLATEHELGEPLLRAVWARATVAVNQGDAAAARSWADRCAAVVRQLDDPAATEAATYPGHAQLIMMGQLEETLCRLETVVPAPLMSDWRGSAQLQARLTAAITHMLRGEFEDARRVAIEVQEQSARCGERWTGAFAIGVVARADLAQGRAEAALDNARAAVSGHRLMHNTAGIAFCIDILAAAEAGVEDGDVLRATRLHGVTRRAWEPLGREQFSLATLIAARQERERALRARLGDEAFEQAYAEGLAMSYDEGLDYALAADT